MYCYRSWLWLVFATGRRAVSEPYYSQCSAVFASLWSAFFISNCFWFRAKLSKTFERHSSGLIIQGIQEELDVHFAFSITCEEFACGHCWASHAVWRARSTIFMNLATLPGRSWLQSGEIYRTHIRPHHHHHHIYFRLPERPQKPIELATIKQQKENCKN